MLLPWERENPGWRKKTRPLPKPWPEVKLTERDVKN